MLPMSFLLPLLSCSLSDAYRFCSFFAVAVVVVISFVHYSLIFDSFLCFGFDKLNALEYIVEFEPALHIAYIHRAILNEKNFIFGILCTLELRSGTVLCVSFRRFGLYCCILVLYGVLVHLGSVPCISFDSCYSKVHSFFLRLPLCCSIYSLIRPPYIRSINRVYWGTHAFDDEFFFEHELRQVCAISNSNQTSDEMEFLFLIFFLS